MLTVLLAARANGASRRITSSEEQPVARRRRGTGRRGGRRGAGAGPTDAIFSTTTKKKDEPPDGQREQASVAPSSVGPLSSTTPRIRNTQRLHTQQTHGHTPPASSHTCPHTSSDTRARPASSSRRNFHSRLNESYEIKKPNVHLLSSSPPPD